jgi:YVTN family beta-propeller protein
MSPDGAYVYVGCRSSDNVAVIETAGNTVATMIGSMPSAGSIAFTRDGAYALVGSRHNSQVAVVDTATYFINYISTPSNARSVAAHPYLDVAYATSGDGTIQVIDTTSFNIITAIPVGNDPYDVVVSPDGGWIFAGSRQGDGLAVIDADSNTLYTTVTGLGDLTGLEVAPDGSVIYASGLSNGVHVIDGATFSHVTTIGSVGSVRQVAVTCDGGELYVGNKGNQAPIVDTGTFSVVDQITLPGSGAQGSAICPQHIATGVFLSPPGQTNQGARGEVVAHQETLVNVTGAADSFTLTLGSHAWDTALSTDSLGPIADGDALTFAVYVTVPVDAAWYLTDTVLVTATSVASPTVYSDTATFTTQAYAPPQISVSPDVLSSTQYVNQIVTQPLTISNGSGVTLTFDIVDMSVPGAELLLHFDEPAGATTFYDASDNDNHGSCSGSSCPIAGANGRFNAALSFDGVDDYVQVPNGSDLNPQQAIAISAWIYPSDWNGNRRIVQKGSYDDQYRLLAEGGSLRFDLSGVNSLNTTLPATDVWRHVVGVYNGTVMQIWVDGRKEAEENASGAIDITSDSLFIGTKHESAPSGDHFNGLIDEVAIYARALSAEEIEALYWSGPGGSDVSWLSKEPISGTVRTNSSQVISFTFDATGLQPDTYTTQIGVQSNDPLTPFASIPVTMTVLPTANMGWVEGTVTDAATGAPLTATIVALGQPYTVATNPDTGYYKLWLDAGNYTIQAAAAGYVTETAVVDIVAQQGITQDFALVLNVPVLEVSPTSLEVTHDVGDVTTQAMTITNNGPAPLTFELRESDTGFSPSTAYTSLSAILADTTSPTHFNQRLASTTAYVTLSDNDLVALLDTTTHTEIGSVNVGAAGCDHPWQAAMSPDGDHVYVGCRNSGNVAVIETASNTVVTTVGGINGADGIAFTRDGAYALVGSRWNSQVAVVDTATYSVITYIYTPSNARSVAAHPYLDIAYATSTDGTIQVIDTTTFNITASIPVGNDPHDVAVSADGQWVLAGSRRGDGLAVIDADSNTLYTVTGLGDLTGLVVAPDGSLVYACGQWNGVHVIDGVTFNHITTVPDVGNTWEAAVTCDGSELYMGNKGNQVPVIDTATFSVTEQIPLSGSDAHGIAICPQHVARDVPWLSEDPITGTVPGYSSMPVQVTFDATGLQPGIHTAEIIVQSNDPVTPTASVPVTMTVDPTADMGRVTGSVSDAWTGLSLEATVELVGVYSTTARPDYTIWATAGTYSLTAYTSGYVTTTRSVDITAGGLVTENLTLEPAQARIEWAPAASSATAVEGSQVTSTLMISNTGPLPLHIALHEINPTAALQTWSPADLTGRRILYDRAHGEPGDWDYSSLIGDAISAGAVITENWYFPIDAAVLEGYDVLWVNCCGDTTWGFGELNALNDWLNQGGAVLVHGESNDATDGPASVFGINYQSGSCTSGTTTDIAEHPISEGVNAVDVEWTCWRLAPGSGADIVVLDTEGQPHVVAQEQDGGKMVVVASEDFIDWHIGEDDNRLLANNILNWLASPAYTDVPWLSLAPESGTVPGHSRVLVTVAFDAAMLAPGVYEATLAIEHNDRSQPVPIEVPVTLSVVERQALQLFLPLLLKNIQ